jgi:hypothetical protein
MIQCHHAWQSKAWRFGSEPSMQETMKRGQRESSESVHLQCPLGCDAHRKDSSLCPGVTIAGLLLPSSPHEHQRHYKWTGRVKRGCLSGREIKTLHFYGYRMLRGLRVSADWRTRSRESFSWTRYDMPKRVHRESTGPVS